MQFLLDLIEVFLPEIARAMSGSSVLPLRRRFFRAGVGFFTILIAYVSIRIVWSVLVGGEQPSPGMFHLGEMVMLAIVLLSGFTCFLLSGIEGGKRSAEHHGGAHGSHDNSGCIVDGGHSTEAPALNVVAQDPGSMEGDHDDMSCADGTPAGEKRLPGGSRLDLHVATVFDPRKAGVFRRKSGFPWLGIRDAVGGVIPLEVWGIDVKGVSLELSFHVGIESLRVREVGQDHVVSCTLVHDERPRMSLRLVDPKDQVHDLDIVVQNSMRHPLLVFLDGFPLAFSDNDE